MKKEMMRKKMKRMKKMKNKTKKKKKKYFCNSDLDGGWRGQNAATVSVDKEQGEEIDILKENCLFSALNKFSND
jgi:hypothetical protein